MSPFLIENIDWPRSVIRVSLIDPSPGRGRTRGCALTPAIVTDSIDARDQPQVLRAHALKENPLRSRDTCFPTTSSFSGLIRAFYLHLGDKESIITFRRLKDVAFTLADVDDPASHGTFHSVRITFISVHCHGSLSQEIDSKTAGFMAHFTYSLSYSTCL